MTGAATSPPTNGRERAVHACDDDDDTGAAHLVETGKDAVQARDADVTDAHDLDACGTRERLRSLLGHRLIRRSCADNEHGRRLGAATSMFPIR